MYETSMSCIDIGGVSELAREGKTDKFFEPGN